MTYLLKPLECLRMLAQKSFRCFGGAAHKLDGLLRIVASRAVAAEVMTLHRVDHLAQARGIGAIRTLRKFELQRLASGLKQVHELLDLSSETWTSMSPER